MGYQFFIDYNKNTSKNMLGVTEEGIIIDQGVHKIFIDQYKYKNLLKRTICGKCIYSTWRGTNL